MITETHIFGQKESEKKGAPLLKLINLCAYQTENFLKFLKHPKLLILVLILREL